MVMQTGEERMGNQAKGKQTNEMKKYAIVSFKFCQLGLQCQ
jgi:hypothetical protein